MLAGNRNSIRRTARGLLALMAGSWLLIAVAPCVMAGAMPAPLDHANCCPDHKAPDCDTLAALDCQVPQPVPPSASFDIPASVPVLLYALPAALDLPSRPAAPAYVRIGASPPPPHVLNRKHSRLLI